MKPAAALLALLLAGCATQDPQVGIHANTVTGRVSPSLSTSVGGLRVSANGSGGSVGTRIGWLGLSAGF